MYSLKWGNHQKSLAPAFKSLRINGDFCDVAIACENRIFETHKLVFATSSSVFNNILRRYSHPHPMIYLRGLKASDMALLEFMYCGEVKVKEDQLQSFLAAAQELNVQGLISNHKKELQGNSLATRFHLTGRCLLTRFCIHQWKIKP